MADTDQVLNLAAIIREVDGNHSKGAAALAESILDHPDFRAALTKPDEPAVPQGREPAAVSGRPSDEELLDLLPQGNESGFWLPKGLPSDWVDGEFIAPPKAIIAFARDVLELWGNPAPQPAAVTGQLSDEELLKLAQQYSVVYLRSDGSACHPFQEGYDMRSGVLNFARAVLARWGNPAPQPAAVTGQPSDEELRELYQGPGTFSPIEYAHDLLARRDNPTPQPPADGEVAEVMGLFRHWAEAYPDSVTVDPYWLTRAAELLQQMEDLAADAVAGLRYIEESCGRLYGVGWDRVYGKADRLKPAHALPLPEVGE